MDKSTQIRARVSSDTKEFLERQVRASGLNKDYLVEQALRHYLLALEQIPGEYIIRPKLVVTRESGEAVFRQVESGKPTTSLRDLVRDPD
jgi:hypothetical protein